MFFAVFAASEGKNMLKISFFVPETHLERVKQAVFSTGAGKIGLYDCCAWQTLGEGQFRPLTGSQPFLGQANQLERVAEYKVELVCEEALITAAIAALKATHPYEEPAYEVISLLSY